MFRNLLVCGEDGTQVVPNDLGRLCSVDTMPEALGLVVVNDGAGLSVVGFETTGEGLGVVVGALNEGFASDIVNTSLFGWAADTILNVERRYK